jgi:DNA-binding CsgD family transcriptional regulator
MALVADEPKLAVDALDALDLGVVVCAPALDRVLFANEAARRLLREIGADHVHPSLRAAIASSRQLMAAVRLALPSGARLFVRTRQIRDALLVTLRGEVLREDDLFELLRRRFDLSIRDRQVIALVRVGHSNQHIAEALGISVGTVKQYLNRVFKTFDVHSRGELVALIERIAREQLAT